MAGKHAQHEVSHLGPRASASGLSDGGYCRPPRRGPAQRLSFCDGMVPRHTMSSRLIHVLAGVRVSFLRRRNTPLRVQTTLGASLPPRVGTRAAPPLGCRERRSARTHRDPAFCLHVPGVERLGHTGVPVLIILRSRFTAPSHRPANSAQGLRPPRSPRPGPSVFRQHRPRGVRGPCLRLGTLCGSVVQGQPRALQRTHREHTRPRRPRHAPWVTSFRAQRVRQPGSTRPAAMASPCHQQTPLLPSHPPSLLRLLAWGRRGPPAGKEGGQWDSVGGLGGDLRGLQGLEGRIP